jgi:acyl phosphate:glycerol-3-phosphate acyltransferase
MMLAMLVWLALVYLLAAVPFGLVGTTMSGVDVDVRNAGSGNIGATNVARVYGWRMGAPVLALDALKGFVPVLAARWLWPDEGLWWWAIVAAVAFVGHCWPIYLEFKGGKGVSTGAGALLAIAPLATLLGGLLWGALLAVTGRSSIAALGATVGLVAISWWVDPPIVPIAAVLAVGVLVRHLANIGRLVRGEEKEVVRPVRWGKRTTDVPTAAEVLAQDPAGGDAPTTLWKDPPPDPLREDGGPT